MPEASAVVFEVIKGFSFKSICINHRQVEGASQQLQVRVCC